MTKHKEIIKKLQVATCHNQKSSMSLTFACSKCKSSVTSKESLVLLLCKPQANYSTRCDHTSQRSVQSHTQRNHFGAAYLFSAQIMRIFYATFGFYLQVGKF